VDSGANMLVGLAGAFPGAPSAVAAAHHMMAAACQADCLLDESHFLTLRT